MRIHLLGICGTFMAGIALLAKQMGHEVTGSDAHVYPPMSTQLQEQGIALLDGYEVKHLQPAPDLVIVGNVIKRGNEAMEYILNEQIPYISGPQWLYENILKTCHVLAVAGTHGKTTTASMLAWILEEAGLNPGFLIGGVSTNFNCSSRLTKSKFFVIEADEYDTAFFDKRSKFVHYHPRTLILNNLEFDHADIFNDLSDIKRQFHHLVRTVPSEGLIIANEKDKNIEDVLSMGCWTPIQYFGSAPLEIDWDLLGEHNIDNASAAVMAAKHVGVDEEKSIQALSAFKSVKRRMELKFQSDNLTIYDDFAHHPTAIEKTLQGLRQKVGKQPRIIVILELGSYTMRTGEHEKRLIPALKLANYALIKRAENSDWTMDDMMKNAPEHICCCESVDEILKKLKYIFRKKDTVLVMSNTGFNDIHSRLQELSL